MINTIGIVSLSSGILGEAFIKHELDIGINRLKEMGVNVKIMKNALKGMDYLRDNPQKRAEDLINAFLDDEIDMILCAIGGDDTYRLLPYLMEGQLKRVINKKIFLGFSDTTINHLMFHSLGLPTYYGQAFLPDVCELSDDMLPYSKKYFMELIETSQIEKIVASSQWYEEREDFSPKSIGTERISHNNRGFELISGKLGFRGKILGGCIESIYQIFDSTRSIDSVELCQRYHIFPDLEYWKNNILLLETSESKSSPIHFKKMLLELKKRKIFDVISGLLVGKPIDEIYYEEYKSILLEVIDNNIPILYNINIGHSTPRAIVPFGVDAIVQEDYTIKFQYK